MIGTYFKKYYKYLILVGLVAFSVSLYFITPETLIEYIGAENAYVLMFLIAFIGGVSLFSGLPYPVFLISFSLGGLDPYILGGVCALGVVLGDCTSYMVGKKSDVLLGKKTQYVLDELLIIYEKFPKTMPFVFLIYGAVCPLPNDVITLSAGIKKYSFWRTMIPLSIGNLIFCVTISKYSLYFSNYFS
jgi:membrane protein YqaA with SNARE-associated domain